MTPRSWREARRYVLPALVAGTALLLARRREAWVAFGVAGVVAGFFRDPERQLVAAPEVVYAAADGVVDAVDAAATDPWVPGEDAVRISTFLSLHNVHVNRSPVEGQITATEASKGGYAPAFLGRSQANARNRLAIDGKIGRVVVVQISGMVARKISCWVLPEDSVTAGQRIGLIHFGSRTDVLLPAGSVDVLVRPGDRVRSGITPLARHHEKKGTTCGST